MAGGRYLNLLCSDTELQARQPTQFALHEGFGCLLDKVERHADGSPSPAHPPQQAASGAKPTAPKQAPAAYTNSAAVYIGNLQWWTTDAEMEALCARHGAVERIPFFEEKGSGKSKGYVLVTFATAKAAYECKQELDRCGNHVASQRCLLCHF